MRKRPLELLPLAPARLAVLDRRLDELPRPREWRDLAEYRRGRNRRSAAWDGGYTMLSSRRGRALHRLAADVDRRGVPGALVDCGVWNGGSSMLLAQGAPRREVWAFDSFEGLPEPGPLDGEMSAAYTGACQGSEEKLREGFKLFADPARLHVVKGWFDDTFPRTVEQIGAIAVLHVDGDWYDSVRLTLDTFFPAVSAGGFVVIDDYGTWPGARRATDEYRARVGERARLVRIDHTGRYWRKSPSVS